MSFLDTHLFKKFAVKLQTFAKLSCHKTAAFYVTQNLRKNANSLPSSPCRFDPPPWCFFLNLHTLDPTWMSQEVSKWLGSVGYNPNIPHIYKQIITPLQTIYILTSWDIHACPYLKPTSPCFKMARNSMERRENQND